MNQPTRPSKQEILEKYRHVIGEEDFDIIMADHPPSPAESQREGTWLQVLGTLDGWTLLTKKNAWGIVVAVVVFVSNYGDFFQGLDTMGRHAAIALNQVQDALQKGTGKFDPPANGFLVALPPEYPHWSSDFPTTTTTTPPLGIDLPPGSGLVPYNSEWGSLG